MILRIDHVAIAVKDHEQAAAFFVNILGALPGSRYEAKDRKFYWQTLALGDLSRLEIISPSGEGSFLDGFLKTREGGFHHITLQTPDLSAMIAHLEAHHIPYFGRHEYPDGTWKEVFIHPRDAFGVLIQISEFDAEFCMIPEAKLPPGKRWQLEKQSNGYSLVCAHPGGGKVALSFTRDELKMLSDEMLQLLQ